MSAEEICDFIVPRRSLTHRKTRKQLLSHEESDRALRMAGIISHAEEVFGDDAKAARWLRKPKAHSMVTLHWRWRGQRPELAPLKRCCCSSIIDLLHERFRVILWRISNYPNLNGVGGLYVSGRWHTKHHPIVYCTLNPSTALLEILVHIGIDVEDRPDRFQLLKIEEPDTLSRERIEANGLPADWATDITVSESVGDRWLSEDCSLLLRFLACLFPRYGTCS